MSCYLRQLYIMILKHGWKVSCIKRRDSNLLNRHGVLIYLSLNPPAQDCCCGLWEDYNDEF